MSNKYITFDEMRVMLLQIMRITPCFGRLYVYAYLTLQLIRNSNLFPLLEFLLNIHQHDAYSRMIFYLHFLEKIHDNIFINFCMSNWKEGLILFILPDDLHSVR